MPSMPFPSLRCNWNFLKIQIRLSHWSRRSLRHKTSPPRAMTSKPPPSPEDSPLPPRHRPNLSDFVKDATEQDLWAFDDLDPLPGNITEPATEPRDATIPSPRNPKKPKTRQPDDSSPANKGTPSDRLQINVGKNRTLSQAVIPTTSAPSVGSDFDDLDHWDEPASAATIEDFFAEIPAPTVAPVATEEPFAKAVIEQSAPTVSDKEEFSPSPRENTTPVSLRPHLNLTKVERIGLATLAGMLVIGAIVISIYTVNRLPTESVRVKANDFPIKGQLVTILSVESYWRAPIMEGKNMETVRRGTQLVPVVDISSRGGPAAIRVFFRNSDREVVGDAVNRSVQSGTTLQVAATAGFEDIGMHAAYRTGQSKPWTIEVYEAPAENSPGKEFKKLFEMNISTNRR